MNKRGLGENFLVNVTWFFLSYIFRIDAIICYAAIIGAHTADLWKAFPLDHHIRTYAQSTSKIILWFKNLVIRIGSNCRKNIYFSAMRERWDWRYQWTLRTFLKFIIFAFLCLRIIRWRFVTFLHIIHSITVIWFQP